jgi:hypothetical protein
MPSSLDEWLIAWHAAILGDATKYKENKKFGCYDPINLQSFVLGTWLRLPRRQGFMCACAREESTFCIIDQSCMPGDKILQTLAAIAGVFDLAA